MEIRAAVELAVDSLQGLVRDHELVVVAGGRDLFVHADEARLVQCVVNLLHNAAKYTPPGGRIEVSSRASRKEAGFAAHMTKPAELAAVERLFMELGSGAAPAAMGSHRGAHGAPPRAPHRENDFHH